MEDIEKLISLPKKIIESENKHLRVEDKHFRNEFKLSSTDNKYFFRMFIRKSCEFPENFSIGLDYIPKTENRFPLIRFNGPHYVTDDVIKSHPHFGYHIHMMKAEDLEKEKRQLSFSNLTQEFDSYEKALTCFIKRVNIINSEKYFQPELDFG